MMEKIPVAFFVQRIGPYHHARFCVLGGSESLALNVVEFRPADSVYAWTAVEETGPYARFQVQSTAEVNHLLHRLQPGVIVCVGYSDPEISRVLAYALSENIPLVVCSDSTHEDEPRSSIKEAVKRGVLGSFAAGLVAGQRAHDYLASLGMGAERRFQPWDVVDNSHFSSGAELSRREAATIRTRLNLPSRYFICVARFIPKKNLGRLIEAYALYVQQAGSEAWSLVLSGSGPLELELRAMADAAGLARKVIFPGFLQYPDLPVWYGLADVAVLPSLSDQWGLVVNEAMAAGLPVLVSARCGCAADLVSEGENGYTFQPEDAAGLAALLARLAALNPAQLAAMGKRSGEIIDRFSPAAFAEAVQAAVAYVRQQRPGHSASWRTRLTVNLLALRAVPAST